MTHVAGPRGENHQCDCPKDDCICMNNVTFAHGTVIPKRVVCSDCGSGDHTTAIRFNT